MQKLFIFLSLILISNTLKSQEINVLDFSTYKRSSKQKPTIIYINTDWCSICKIQKHQLNKEKDLVKELNNDFSVIELNAEKYTKDIYFFGKNYTYYPNGTSGIHELAYSLTNGTNAYPMWVFLDSKNNIIKKIPGLISNSDFRIILAELKKSS